jgi:hypothetical protein
MVREEWYQEKMKEYEGLKPSSLVLALMT